MPTKAPNVGPRQVSLASWPHTLAPHCGCFPVAMLLPAGSPTVHTHLLDGWVGERETARPLCLPDPVVSSIQTHTV